MVLEGVAPCVSVRQRT